MSSAASPNHELNPMEYLEIKQEIKQEPEEYIEQDNVIYIKQEVLAKEENDATFEENQEVYDEPSTLSENNEELEAAMESDPLAEQTSPILTGIETHQIADVVARKTSKNKKDMAVYQCQECDFSSYYKIIVQRHVTQHTEKSAYQCNMCSFSSKGKPSLTKHMKYYHIKEKLSTGERKTLYQCTECAFNSEFKYSMSKHMLSHSVGAKRVFQCSECTFKTVDENTLHKHKHFECLKYCCDRCDYKSSKQQYLINHMTTHGEDDVVVEENESQVTYKCQKCSDEGFQDESSLLKHMRFECKPFVCNVCGYKCARNFYLQKHILTHSSVKDLPLPYHCDKCTFKTPRVQSLKRHKEYKH